MRRTTVLLVLLLVQPARAAEPARPDTAVFSVGLVASVLAAAMDFIVPRSLEPTSAPQLAEWGLHGVTALDPALAAEAQGDSLRLFAAGEPVFRRDAPAADASAQSWAAAAAELGLAAWTVSDPVRQAGMPGFIRGFFEEMFNHLDPYSRYVPPEAARGDRARRSGEAGVGLQLARRGGAVVALEVNGAGPAAEAGIRPGDRILAVDGRPVRGQDAAAVAGWMAGEEGTGLTLTFRGRDGRARTVELEREVVVPETVYAERLGNALVVRISAFSRDTDQRLADELERGLGDGRAGRVRGVVFDLRGNRGGLLRQAVATTGLMLTGGQIATTSGRNPLAAHSWSAGGADGTGGRPIVVLVDGRSASAAEIMAAALSDNGRAVVVGSSTLGKGLVQTITPLPDGGELFVTWSRVLAPKGWPIQGLGVLPQVCTSRGQDALDRQLAALQRGRLTTAQALAEHRAARAPLPAARVVELRNACPAAEGREADLAAARFLLDHPAAYGAALLPGAP